MTGPSSRPDREAADDAGQGDGSRTRADERADPVIRPLGGRAEREACVALQERVWGDAFADRVPASVLMIALETGGVASGAFLDGRLVGFVFGITGLREGRPIHWSDMLAVAPEHRGEGIGHRLKLHQRALLLERGVETVRWTFDPLEARNAHINLRRLGAVAGEYGVLRSDGVTELALLVNKKKGILRYIDVHDINERPDLKGVIQSLRGLH